MQFLVQGSNDWRINAKVDYKDGTQITQSELEAASSIIINYKYLIPDGDDTTEASWTATGYGETSESIPYVYYVAVAGDEVPDGAQRLIGRVVITDNDGLISKSEQFEIKVYPDEL